MNRKKGSATVIFLVILLIAGGTYWYLDKNVFSKDPSRKEIELRPRDDTANSNIKPFAEIRMVPPEVEKGGSFKLLWNTKGVKSCIASSQSAPELPFKMEWEGEVPLNGEKYYSDVPHSLTFDLNCKTEGGQDVFETETLSMIDKDSKKPASIKVLAPNGGETYRLGKSELIRWKSEGTNLDIDIDLIKEDGTVAYNLSSDIDSMTGSQLDSFGPAFIWNLPTADNPDGVILEPGKYKIRVKFIGESGISDMSDDFFMVIGN